MGIFTRFKDIVASNINSMLDNAEDPEKLIRLMIREMEDTLIEIKTSCANAIAGQKKAQRFQDEVDEKEFLEPESGTRCSKRQRQPGTPGASGEKTVYPEG